jgi:CBS domain-containing protein
MRVRDIMQTRVQTIDQEQNAEAAFSRMRLNRIHHLVVTAGPEIVAERDLGGKDRQGMRQTLTVQSFMTPYAVKAKPGMTVRQAAALMRGWSIGCLPVVDGQGLVGIVTVSDLLDLVARGEPRRTAPTGTRTAKRTARRPAGRPTTGVSASLRRRRRPASSGSGASTRRS